MSQSKFERELEVFRTEQEAAQQYFFSWLSMGTITADPGVREMMELNPHFWVTARHALILSAFVALGRIFDQNSKHNLNVLIKAASDNLRLFSRAEQAARKVAAKALSAGDAATQLVNAFENKRRFKSEVQQCSIDDMAE